MMVVMGKDYLNEIISEQIRIQYKDGYCFQWMTAQGVEETFVNAVKDSIDHLKYFNAYDNKSNMEQVELARRGFVRIAAMCLIALGVADNKKELLEKNK